MESDNSIVRRILDGDVEAYQILVDRHKSKLMGVLMNLLRDRVVAEDAAQDTFVKGYTRLATYRANAMFSTWLIQIGVHVARDRHRELARLGQRGIVSLDDLRQQRRGDWEPEDRRTSANPAGDLESRERIACFQQAMSELPAAFREAVTLRHLEQLDYEEIAQITGDSPGTMRVRTHRARLMIQRRMEAMGIELAPGRSTRKPPSQRQQKGT